MKKLFSVLVLIFCFIVVVPLVKAQDYAGSEDYDGWVSKQQMPVHRESRGLDIRHYSVKFGGKKLAWVSTLNIRFRGNYSKSSPRFILSQKTTRLIGNNKARKRR